MPTLEDQLKMYEEAEQTHRKNAEISAQNAEANKWAAAAIRKAIENRDASPPPVPTEGTASPQVTKPKRGRPPKNPK